MTHPSGLLALTDDKTRRLRMSQMPEFVETELDTTGVDLVELHGMVMRGQPLPSELVAYDRRLPDVDRVKLEEFLIAKWGL